MPTHCTITHFRFRAGWINGIKCGLFSNHTPLGQTTLRVGIRIVYYRKLRLEVGMWDNERKGEGKTRCRLIACSSRKTPRGPPGLMSTSDGRIALNSTICLLDIYTAEGFGIQSRPVMYNLTIRKCTSPPLLAPRLKIFT